MHHQRHYTQQEASAARGWVAERVRWVRSAQARLAALGVSARAVIEGLDPGAGGAYPGREIALPLVELSRAMAELEAVDVVLRDVERGLIDFPAMIGGDEVYLCWLLDEEEEIGFWHPIEGGFAGRRPLP